MCDNVQSVQFILVLLSSITLEWVFLVKMSSRSKSNNRNFNPTDGMVKSVRIKNKHTTPYKPDKINCNVSPLSIAFVNVN